MIYITIKDAEARNDKKSAFLQFQYHPKKVEIVKSLKDRKWNMETKLWEIDPSDISEFQNTILSEFPNENFEVKEEQYNRAIPETFSFVCEPLPHQKEAIEFGLNHPSFLLGDQQGLGKTYESLMISEIRRKEEGLRHCLVLCGVNSLKQNWRREIQQFVGEDSHIVGERRTKTGKIKQPSNQDKLEDLEKIDELPYYLILNIESLQSKEIARKLSDLCVDKINMILFDELHKCKSVRSKSGEALLTLNPKYKIGLTGTPMLRDPLDLYLFLRWIGVEQRNYWQFNNHYQIWKEITLKELDEFGERRTVKIPIGFQNLDEIQRKIKTFMIRRLKSDVLDLPDKIHSVEYLEMNKKQRDIYDEIRNNLLEEVDKIEQSSNPLARLLRLRQSAVDTTLVSSGVKESVKIDRCEDIVEECIQNGEKVIVFTYHHEVAQKVAQRLKKHKPAVILRETEDVEKQKEKFKNKTDVLIGTIGVLGTGHTLTEATTVIFLEEPWSYGELEQAEDRAHRIGQKKNVSYITLLCKDTVDERIHEIIQQKKDFSDMIVDHKQKVSVRYLLK